MGKAKACRLALDPGRFLGGFGAQAVVDGEDREEGRGLGAGLPFMGEDH
jgi:hypothetical protein